MTEPIQVLSGNPTDEELAALVLVLSKLHAVRPLPEPTTLTKWGSPTAHLRNRLDSGNQAWRQSAWARH